MAPRSSIAPSRGHRPAETAIVVAVAPSTATCRYVAQSLPWTLPWRRQMRDAVAAFDAAEMASADDGACPAEMGRNGRARRIVDEMDVAAELAGRDLLADTDRELEQAGIGCQHEIIATADLEEPHLVILRWRALGLDDVGMSEKATQAVLDQGDG